MTVVTDTIYAQCVLNCAVEDEGRVSVIPFMQVKVFDANGVAKTVYCNYSFGTVGDKGIEFHSALGKLKMLELGALRSDQISSDVGVIIRVMQRGKKHLVPDMLDDLQKLKPFERILFVWDKAMSQDDPFYAALNIEVGPKAHIAPPLTLASAGLTLDPDSLFSEVEL